MRLLDLFSGIGGFSLAASWVWPDLEIEAFVEIDAFCQKVLRKNFPGVPIYDDIKKIHWIVADSESMGWRNGIAENERKAQREINPLSNSPKCSFTNTKSQQTNPAESGGLHPEPRMEVRTSRIDLLTGGFPCQPFSCAGKRQGTEDDRFLWPQVLRTIHEVNPRWVVAENVPGLLTSQDGMVFEGVCADLENEGYEVQPLIIPACAQGAPHRRDRVWIVAKNSLNGGMRGGNDGNQRRGECSLQTQGSDCHAPDSEITAGGLPIGKREENSRFGESSWQEYWYEVATRFCRVDARVSNRVDRLKCLGNAIVPQIAEQIFRAIKEK